MEPSPIAVEAAGHAPDLSLKDKTALMKAFEDVLCGSVCAITLLCLCILT
jgi:ornithine carrier protein